MEKQNINSEINENVNQPIKSKKSFPTKVICLILAFVITFFGGGILSVEVYKRLFPSPSEKLAQINSLVREYYSGEIDDAALDDALATAYMKAINDKYGFYKNAEDSVLVENSLEGNSSGIGVTVFNDEENGSLTVFRVDSKSPADKVGIKAGDMITAIDGKKVSEIGFTESVNSIRREIGQKAKITVMRDAKSIDFNVVYEDFIRQSVYYEVINDFGFICITAFNEATVAQFEQAYKDLAAQKVKGLVFDLRDNGGGTVDSVCKILDTLVGECDLITIVYADGSKKVSAKSNANKCDLPMAVLTNENTASASELFTANLKDMSKALVVGNNTYGKGVVQRTYFLSDGSCVRFTVGEFLPAGGVGFNKKGIAPDFEVSFTEEQAKKRYTLGKDDPYLKKAIEQLEKMVTR